MDIVPDTKNWTWVLERPCPDCAFDAQHIAVRDIGMMTRDLASQWEVVLGLPGSTTRPRPDVWSPSEYGCHVRDVLRLFDERLALMLDQRAHRRRRIAPLHEAAGVIPASTSKNRAAVVGDGPLTQGLGAARAESERFSAQALPSS